MRCDPCDFLRLGRQGAEDEKVCRLWWSGAGIRLTAACSTLEIEAESFAPEHAPWIGVLADGAPVARFPLLPGRRRYPVLAGMDAAISHEITILRDTQPTEDEPAPVTLHALYTDGTLQTAPARPRLIEFIGDSLTVGEGTLGPCSAQEWRMAWISNMMAYPTLVTERLRAEKRVVALGGWGVWKSWDGLPEHRLGLIYEKLSPLIRAGDVPYRFAERPADAVVINLGTNDSGPFSRESDPQAAGEALTARALELLRMVRRHQPEAYILWAYGLCGDAVAPYLRAAVAKRKAEGDGRVEYLPLDDCGGDLGARQHPSRAAHRRAAEQIYTEICSKADI